METSIDRSIISKDGIHGAIDSAYPLDGSQTQVLVRWDDGPDTWVPLDLLRPGPRGGYFLPLALDQLHAATGAAAQDRAEQHGEERVIPVVEETLAVGTRQVSTGGVRLTKRVHEREEVVDQPGFREEIHVERVPVDRLLDEPAQVRQEGDTTVIPVMEEVLVVEKRLVLREEIRVTRRREEVRSPQSVTLRREEVLVEPIGGEA